MSAGLRCGPSIEQSDPAAVRKSLRVQPTPPVQFKARKVVTIHTPPFSFITGLSSHRRHTREDNVNPSSRLRRP